MDEFLLTLLNTFLAESTDFLDDVEPQVIMLAQQYESTVTNVEHSSETINNIFRLFHTLKGNASIFEFKNIIKLAHNSENLLDNIRSNKLTLTKERITILCKSIDLLRKLIAYAGENLNDKSYEDELEEIVDSLHITNGEHAKDMAVFVDGICWVDSTYTAESETSEYSDVETVETEETFEEEAAPIEELVTQIDLSAIITDEMRSLFLQEADEIFVTLESSLLKILKEEYAADVQNLVIEAFRAIHSFKGNCGFMGLENYEALSHAMESVLDEFRTSQENISEIKVQLVLNAIDSLKFAINSNNLFVKDKEKIIYRLLHPNEPIEVPVEPEQVKVKKIKSKVVNAKNPITPDVVVSAKVATGQSLDKPKPTAEQQKNVSANQMQKQDIRVSLDKLDKLMNLVGELVIAETMVTENPYINNIEDSQLEKSIYQLRRIIMDLQDVSMSVRMIPIAQTFKKLIRLVHELSSKTNKKINLSLVGEETEVDKTVVEMISDPLVHVIRNSADHGIELPADRLSKGKPEIGTITVEAKHEGGEVWILIKDDGKGLDKEKLLKKALENGLIRQENIDSMLEEDIFKLIFEPGFSTADKVSDISGRGVGMDVVRKNIEKLKGKVKVKSTLNQGTTIIFQIPLTLAIIDGTLVRVGDSKYSIPMLSIQESKRPAPETLTIGPDGQEYVNLRQITIPIIRMHDVFRKQPDHSDLCKGILIIVENNRQLYALYVDEVLGQQQTVIKGLSTHFGQSNAVSGCTILGNGDVSLIVDVSGICENLRSNYFDLVGQ